MKKKYFAPEVEEMEIEELDLLVTSTCPDESEGSDENLCLTKQSDCGMNFG